MSEPIYPNGILPEQYNLTTDEVVRSLFGVFRYNLKSVAPAIVKSYDREANRAIVSLAARERIVAKDTAGNDLLYRHGDIVAPVLQMSGGGFTFSFPLNEGDTGWLVATDMDCSRFLSTKSEFTPNTNDGHEYARSLFIPDGIFSPQAGIDAPDSVVLSNKESDTKIVFKNGEVLLQSAQITLKGDISVLGDMSVDGKITATGDITAVGKSVSTHRHTDSEGGTTSQPL